MFWYNLSKLILKNRKTWLFILFCTTLFMGYMASKIAMSYELARILPKSDQNYKLYEDFKKRFGEDGNVMVIAIKTNKIYELEVFNQWYDLSKKIKNIDGIKNVLSNANLFGIQKDSVEKKFIFPPLVSKRPTTQAEIDSVKAKIERLPFYKGTIYSTDGEAHLMAVTFQQSKLNSKERINVSREIETAAREFGVKNNIEVHFSGMPFIRTNFISKVSAEMTKFLALAFLVTIGILYIFFRSFKTVLYTALLVLISVVWSVGYIVLFGYKITILTGLIPPLIIVIGIPNTIFLVNKYQEEYLKHNDKIRALAVAIEKIGKTTFLANVTTSIGFFVFYFTGSPLLLEFGLVAAICIMSTWAISLILIPILFSYSAPPSAKNVRHLENKNITKFLRFVNHIVHNSRTALYTSISLLVVIFGFGMFQLKAIGYIVDDLPQNDPIYADLKFIEKHFHGIVPFEVVIDTKKENGVLNPQVLNKIKLMQREFAKYEDFTNPISLVEAIKLVYQGYRGGDPKYYQLPGALELQKLAEYVGTVKGKENLATPFIDSTKRFTRVSFQCGDAGTVRIRELVEKLQPKIDTIFNFDKESQQWLPKEQQIDAKITGNGVVFMKGNDYLLQNLIESTIWAIILVCIVMATQFFDVRMILISTIPSILPLIITAGVMGYFGIPLKPTTTLVFSIAFGISSDGTIYFLTKFKDEMKNHKKTVSHAITETIMYTGISMFYTAIILFFGFGIFAASNFKGTVYLGTLVSTTLLMGMIANLILLPSFIMTLEKKKTKV
ncbi:patched family protein [Emticicia oligotrophica DSM 17448]|uniref:Patched family protein n=2 Tax=Emticicia TaxID=312278 RepID=A0ABM5N6G4_EMTOG|nr:patched family protein [Emticicia oligotrophica DSM 17448]